MNNYVLEIIGGSKKTFQRINEKDAPFYIEGSIYVSREDGEGERLEFKGLLRPQEKKIKISPHLVIAN